jgi:hypothetical protein
MDEVVRLENAEQAVKWADQILTVKTGKELQDIKIKWLEHKYVTETSRELIAKGSEIDKDVLKQIAHAYIKARISLDPIGSGASVKDLDTNTQELILKYVIKTNPPPSVPLPSVFSPFEMVEYIINSALRGQLSPLASHISGNPIEIPSLNMDPASFKKALNGDPDQRGILQNKITQSVGVSAFAFILYKGLLKIYDIYHRPIKDRSFLLQVQGPPIIWEQIKKALNLNSTRSPTFVSDDIKEMWIVNPRVLTKSGIRTIQQTLVKKLEPKTKISLSSVTRYNEKWPLMNIRSN